MIITKIMFKEWFDRNKKCIIKDFCEYLSMKTTSPDESIAYDFLGKMFTDLGFKTWKEQISEEAILHYEHCPYPMSKITSEDYNFKSFFDAKCDKTLLISCHIDVVPSSDKWESAYTPVIKMDEKNSEVIYARGACDTKGNLLMFLTSLRFLKDNKIPLAFNIEYDGVVEEEIGGIGALSTALLKKENKDIYGVIVLEPTSFKIYRGHRGCLGVTITIKGESTHMGSSSAMSPVEAIGYLVEALNDLEKEFISIAKMDEAYRNVDRPVQINIGKIIGGQWHGSTMHDCQLSVNVGFPHEYNIKQVENRLHKILKEQESKTNLNYIIELDGIRNEAYIDNDNKDFYNNFKNKIQEVTSENGEIGAWKVSCDARIYANHMSVPTLIFGCGDLEDAHNCDEKLRISDLEKAAYVFAKYLSNTN